MVSARNSHHAPGNVRNVQDERRAQPIRGHRVTSIRVGREHDHQVLPAEYGEGGIVAFREHQRRLATDQPLLAPGTPPARRNAIQQHGAVVVAPALPSRHDHRPEPQQDRLTRFRRQRRQRQFHGRAPRHCLRAPPNRVLQLQRQRLLPLAEYRHVKHEP